MRFDIACASEKGPRRENEDAVGFWRIGSDGCAVAVADGVGGHLGGKLAAETAVRMFGEKVPNAPFTALGDLTRTIHDEIKRAQQSSPELRAMATTFSAAVIKDSRICVVHCGDTRIAMRRGSGIMRLTEDHTEARRLLENGTLTRTEYAHYPRKNVLESALGISRPPQIDVISHDLVLGDALILTTDGLHTKVLLREMLPMLATTSTAQSFIDVLMTEAAARSPEDNYTAAAVFVSE